MGDASDDEDEEDLSAGLKQIEAQLLAHDPDFDAHHTLDAQSDWTRSLVHAFLRGPRPFDPESQREAHQLHLNVERIRVPEVVFQPGIAGLDQADLVEIVANIATQRLSRPEDAAAVLRDVFLTGGNTYFRGFEERLARELAAALPAGATIRTRRAKNASNDAWKGAAQMAAGTGLAAASVTREEYAEKGSEYLKVGATNCSLRYTPLTRFRSMTLETHSTRMGRTSRRLYALDAWNCRLNRPSCKIDWLEPAHLLQVSTGAAQEVAWYNIPIQSSSSSSRGHPFRLSVTPM